MNSFSLDYEKIIVIKAIIENSKGEILLVQEPITHTWMPGRWGLPGGKPFEKESLRKAFKRKIKEELGLDLESKGIFRIEELLIKGMTILMVHAVSEFDGSGSFRGHASDFKWVSAEEIGNMQITQFTEYFNKKLLLEYLAGNKKLVNFDLIETQSYFKLSEDPEYREWFKQEVPKDDK